MYKLSIIKILAYQSLDYSKEIAQAKVMFENEERIKSTFAYFAIDTEMRGSKLIYVHTNYGFSDVDYYELQTTKEKRMKDLEVQIDEMKDASEDYSKEFEELEKEYEQICEDQIIMQLSSRSIDDIPAEQYEIFRILEEICKVNIEFHKQHEELLQSYLAIKQQRLYTDRYSDNSKMP